MSDMPWWGYVLILVIGTPVAALFLALSGKGGDVADFFDSLD